MQRKIKSLRRFYPLLPALFFIVAYLVPLGGRVMIRPDEFRYAEIPREMLRSGAWMQPRLNGVKYFEKPTLGYQFIALSMRVFGENRFAVRLPSALGTLLAAAMVWLVLRKEYRERFWPGAAAEIYLAFALVLGIGTFAVLDAPFAGAVTVSIGAIYLACLASRRMECILWLAAAGVAAAFAFMLKGFLGFILPCTVAVPFLIWSRDWKKLFTFPWLPLAVALLIAVPWALAQHRADPDFWPYFFIEEHWKRFTSGTYDRDAQPFWYFIPVLLGGVMPAGLLWLAGALGCTREWFKRPFVRFMICWFAFPFLLFSISKCKLGTYILPCFPPLALLLAAALRSARKCARGKFRGRLSLIFTAVGAAAMTAGALGFLALTALAVANGKKWLEIPAVIRVWGNPWSMLTVLALSAYGLLLYRLRRGANGAALWLFLTGFAPAVCFGMLAVPESGLGDSAPEAGLRECLKHFPDHEECTIAVERTFIASVCWVTKRDDIVVVSTIKREKDGKEIESKLGELEFGIVNYPREYAAKHVLERDFPLWRKDRKVLYVTFGKTKKRRPSEALSQPVETHTHGGVTVMRF